MRSVCQRLAPSVGANARYSLAVEEAYYLPVDAGTRDASGIDRFMATDATTSPWDTKAQHGGPPVALLASCIEAHAGREGLQLARISADFLGPIPKGICEVKVEILRPGRRNQLTEAVLSAGGRPAVVMRAWQIAASGAGADAGAGSGGGAVPGAGTVGPPEYLPGPQAQTYFPGIEMPWGYGEATEWRFVSGGFARYNGHAEVWTRVKIPLVAGTSLSGLQRALIVADSANGLSTPVDFSEWLFIPPGVTCHFTRLPEGEWIKMTASSSPGTSGIGLTEARLYDAAGEFGTVAQPVLVAER